MSHLFLIRHGTSFFNDINIVAGSMDVPLSKDGIEQSENFKVVPLSRPRLEKNA